MERARSTESSTSDTVEIKYGQDFLDETVGIPKFAITAYGVDFDAEGLVRRLERGDIAIPPFQRDFVWSRSRASRFIESLLVGLPVPGIFLYRESENEKLSVIDGQQRLLSLKYFYSGKFGSSNRSFALSGLETEFDGLAYIDLRDEDRRRLGDSVIHATVVRQDLPDDSGSSQYYIFERLNTGAMTLRPQEIRAAAYRGPFNDLLGELNNHIAWRTLFGKSSRKRDEELILRFLALFFRSNEYAPPMKAFLNQFMKQNRFLQIYDEEQISCTFEDTVTTILDKIGQDAFRRFDSVNAAQLDAVMVGVARRLTNGPVQSNVREQFKTLQRTDGFFSAIEFSTTDTRYVKQRIRLAVAAFSDVD